MRMWDTYTQTYMHCDVCVYCSDLQAVRGLAVFRRQQAQGGREQPGAKRTKLSAKQGGGGEMRSPTAATALLPLPSGLPGWSGALQQLMAAAADAPLHNDPAGCVWLGTPSAATTAAADTADQAAAGVAATAWGAEAVASQALGVARSHMERPAAEAPLAGDAGAASGDGGGGKGGSGGISSSLGTAVADKENCDPAAAAGSGCSPVGAGKSGGKSMAPLSGTANDPSAAPAPVTSPVVGSEGGLGLGSQQGGAQRRTASRVAWAGGAVGVGSAAATPAAVGCPATGLLDQMMPGTAGGGEWVMHCA